MSSSLNQNNQKLGNPLPEWKSAILPSLQIITGKYCILEKLDPKKHTRELFEANSLDVKGINWTYLPYGPFINYDDYSIWIENVSLQNDPFFYAIIDKSTSKAVGVVALMRIDSKVGSIEIGHIHFSSLLQKKIAATEAMYLLMKYCFQLGFRRYEWKCDHLNESSRSAASRLGFYFEGTFRQASIVKGRNRDTDWFSIIDSEWPFLKVAFEEWLDNKNFQDNQVQIKSLRELTRKL